MFSFIVHYDALYVGFMAGKTKVRLICDEKEAISTPTHAGKKQKEPVKNTPGVAQRCIKFHRLVFTDSRWDDRMTQGEHCRRLEDNAHRKLNETFKWLYVSVMTVTSERLHQGHQEIAMLIVPYLICRAGAADTADLVVCMAQVQDVDRAWSDRVCVGLSQNFLALELKAACCLHGELEPGEDKGSDWADCNEYFNGCEFADECPHGQCVCPPGYYWDYYPDDYNQ